MYRFKNRGQKCNLPQKKKMRRPAQSLKTCVYVWQNLNNFKFFFTSCAFFILTLNLTKLVFLLLKKTDLASNLPKNYIF